MTQFISDRRAARTARAYRKYLIALRIYRLVVFLGGLCGALIVWTHFGFWWAALAFFVGSPAVGSVLFPIFILLVAPLCGGLRAVREGSNHAPG